MSEQSVVVLSPQLQAGKSAFTKLVRAFGGQDAAAEQTGKSQSRICAYGHPNKEDFAPFDVVLELEGCTHGQAGHPHVTRWLAQQAGYVLVRLPATELPETIWIQRVALLLQEVGSLANGISAALADDNRISKREAQQQLAAADELLTAAVEIQQALKRRAEGLD